MAFKAVLLCASALLVQSISGQNVNRIGVPSCGCSSNRLSAGNIISSSNILPAANIVSSGLSCSGVSNNGGAFNVQSIGPIVPTGIATATELALAADLAVSGTLPWLSAVEFAGELATAGSGYVDYGCGDGSIGITSVTGGNAGAAGLSTGYANLGGYNNRNCGCGCL